MEQKGILLVLWQLFYACLAFQDVPKNPLRSYDELYADGLEFYTQESWADAATRFRGAIDSYKHEMKQREECYVHCSDHDIDVLRDYSDDEETLFFHSALLRTTCVDRCKHRIGGSSTSTVRGVASRIEGNMMIRNAYNYLQLALHKMGNHSSAASAAATYHHYNPLDEMSARNMLFYRSLPQGEPQPEETGVQYRHLYAEGEKLYKLEKYVEMIDKFEESLKALLPVVDKCRLLCTGPIQWTDSYEYSAAMSYLYRSVLECRASCLHKLGEFRKEPDTTFLASYFNYLQYGYHWDGQLQKAVQAVATHRRIEPNNEVARMNAVYYQQLPGVTKKDHVVREDVLPLIEQLEEDEQLLQIVREISGDSEQQNVLAEEKEDDLSLLLSDIQAHPVVPSSEEEEEEEEGNRLGRMVTDNFISSKQCETLMELTKIVVEGDGYETKSPHTRHEKFEGLTILGAAQAAVENRASIAAATLYMNASTWVKDAVAKHFKLRQPLYFSYTHLVCRTALDDNTQRGDLSHPVHSDNCILDRASGECNKIPPAYTWRDYSALLYINDEFEGGNFFFAHSTKDLSPQEYVQPTCGRVVGFSAGKENMHGVTAVTSGRRCAVALWFTLDPTHQEEAYTKAERVINTLRVVSQ